MKKLLTIAFITLLGGLIVVPRPIQAQEVKPDKKEKTIRIKTIKEENGKKIVNDTSFTFTGDMDELDLEKFGIVNDGKDMDVDVQIVVDSDGDKKTTKKIVVANAGEIKIDEDGKNAFFFESGDGKNARVFKWTDEDGNKMAFNIDIDNDDLVNDLRRIELELEASGEELDSEYLMLFDKLSSLDSLGDIDGSEGLEKLEKLNNFNYVFSSAYPTPSHHTEFMFFSEDNDAVSDIELRDAGIKSKPDRLELENINLEIDNGVVDVEFSVKQEISPKVVVYNVYGDKVFSGKPILMNGDYQLKMDLSGKQHGTYYLMIVSGKSSFTSRMKL
jgi:hypothetical protein